MIGLWRILEYRRQNRLNAPTGAWCSLTPNFGARSAGGL